jgi:glycosyltransferase involved in cell wall biosynthesis
MIPVLSFLLPLELLRVIRAHRPAVVHVHSGCWSKGVMAARLAGVRNIIFTEHGRLVPDSRKVILLDRVYSRITTHIVAVSEALAQYLVEVVRVPKAKVLVIINGVNVERLRTAARRGDEGPVRIGIIARLAPVKDLGTLLRAMKRVVMRSPETELLVVGDGPERAALESLSAELGITGKVRFTGFRRDIPAVLSEIDIFTLSSLSEGTSITLLEAMAAGKPVVVTDVGGNPAIVEEGVNGFLVPASSPEALADALVRLAGNRELRMTMWQANTRKVEERYGIRAMVQQYQRLYEGRS